MDKFLPEPKHYATNAIHAGCDPEQWDSKCIVPPIVLASVHKMSGGGQLNEDNSEYFYSRYGNPTREVLEKTLASLEAAKYAFVYSSGMAAINATCHHLKAGDHVIAMQTLYGGTVKFLNQLLTERQVDVTFVDFPVEENVAKNLRKNTKLVWIESPTNPNIQIVDIKKVATAVHANPSTLLAVDNTFATSFFQRPITLGADIVMYSCTKYINGHSDVTMGAIITNNEEVKEKLRYQQKHGGAIPSAFDCYLAHRGLRTLPVRMREHMKNGLAVAQFLEKHPAVIKVLHPGLPSHPQHKLAMSQSCGHSGMVAFYLRSKTLEESSTFVQALRYFTVAPSLGSDVSLVSIPAILSHAMISQKERDAAGVSDNMIRLSVGLETAEDLIEDLNQALNKTIKY